MKDEAIFFSLVFSLLLLALPPSASALSRNPAIRHAALDDGLLYQVKVAWKDGSTTLRFPGAIDSFSSGHCLSDGANPGQPLPLEAFFRITYTPGRAYLTLRALGPDATDTLTVIYGGTPYVFHLVASAEPDYVVTLRPRSAPGQEKKLMTTQRLLGLIDRAKSYTLLGQTYPETKVGIQYETPGSSTEYRDFRVVIAEVFRFDEADALVFDCLIENGSDRPLYYKPQALAIGLAGQVCPAAAVDASGYVSPRGSERVYIVMVGTPHGGRNNLSPKNNWTILVPRGSGEDRAPSYGPDVETAGLPER
ncbi:MAG: hypothetical protein PHO89_01215 [Methylacidiphilaceae bacterium]|nr:hypothetical protein [Candidatus Methylacidiphilaceae bacterium]